MSGHTPEMIIPQEKQLLDKLGVACSPYRYNQSASDSAKALDLPLVVKSCTDGYDGKNQWVLKTQQDGADFDQQTIVDPKIETVS